MIISKDAENFDEVQQFKNTQKNTKNCLNQQQNPTKR